MPVATHLPHQVPVDRPVAERDLRFPVRSRLGVVRDLAVIGVCAAIIVGFLAQVWHTPPPPAFRAASVTAASARA